MGSLLCALIKQKLYVASKRIVCYALGSNRNNMRPIACERLEPIIRMVVKTNIINATLIMTQMNEAFLPETKNAHPLSIS